MDCKEVRRTLFPTDALRVDDDAVAEAIEHAETCPDCSAFLEEDRRMARLIRERVARVRAPRELRERLFTTLARERAGRYPGTRPRLTRSRWAVAAAALLAVGLSAGALSVWMSERAQEPERGASAFVEDYLRRVVEQETLQSADRREIGVFFARELGIQMEPPDVPPFEVRRALICMLNGRRGGVVEYHLDGRQISYYTVPVGERPAWVGEGLDLDLVEAPLPGSGRFDASSGVAVATWRDAEHYHALVGNLSTAELEQFTPMFTVNCPSARL